MKSFLLTFFCLILANPTLASSGSGIDVDKKALENSKKPIIFGTGLGGIDFTTTYADAKKILTEPTMGPDAEGITVYNNEKIYLRWNDTRPSTPYFMLALPGYLGKIQAQAPFDDIRLDHKFTSYIGDTPREGADELAIDFFHALTGEKSNCLSEETCSVDWGSTEQTFFLMQFPGLILRLAKDDFRLFIAVVEPIQETTKEPEVAPIE